MFNSGFGALADAAIDLYPEDLRGEIDALNAEVYPALNNGVYRAGFATTQGAYEEAFAGVFAMLDALERRLAAGPFLVGGRLTEADVRVFVTLARFDAAYHGIFKCNLRRIADYANLSAYLARLAAVPAFRETLSIDHIKRGYYSIKALNPITDRAAGAGARLDLERNRISTAAAQSRRYGFIQPNPASVSPSGRYSHPTQPW